MFSSKKEFYKVGNILLDLSKACGLIEQFPAGTTEGVYIYDVFLEGDIGDIDVRHVGIDTPTRIQVYYDGALVVDTLYVGDAFSGNPPDFAGFVGGSYSIPEYTWNGSSFSTTGSTINVNPIQADVAAFGSTSGTGIKTFNKPNPTPTLARVVVTKPIAGKNFIVSVKCPTTTTPEVCTNHQVVSYFEQNINFDYIDCCDVEQTITVNNTAATICAKSVSTPPNPSNQWDIFLGEPCTDDCP